MQALPKLRKQAGQRLESSEQGEGEVEEEVGEMGSSCGKESGFYCKGNREPLKVLYSRQT